MVGYNLGLKIGLGLYLGLRLGLELGLHVLLFGRRDNECSTCACSIA